MNIVFCYQFISSKCILNDTGIRKASTQSRYLQGYYIAVDKNALCRNPNGIRHQGHELIPPVRKTGVVPSG